MIDKSVSIKSRGEPSEAEPRGKGQRKGGKGAGASLGKIVAHKGGDHVRRGRKGRRGSCSSCTIQRAHSKERGKKVSKGGSGSDIYQFGYFGGRHTDQGGVRGTCSWKHYQC